MVGRHGKISEKEREKMKCQHKGCPEKAGLKPIILVDATTGLKRRVLVCPVHLEEVKRVAISHS